MWYVDCCIKQSKKIRLRLKYQNSFIFEIKITTSWNDEYIIIVRTNNFISFKEKGRLVVVCILITKVELL